MMDLPQHHLQRIEAAHDRLNVVEGRVHILETNGAVMDQRFKHIQGSLDKIEGSISKGIWIVITAVLLGFVTFVMKGGLNVLGS